ncbi:uncharacterized protein LOC101853087 [Aplysia californica]|uniref:Uncharacterized protein LOC101853087 n=1 Tax=Aplysia californica TaxID=6500 RepID=A0ABM0JPZ1_APLCA|nr:uncharacterized protein LOC101853087 [Aplysia californica]
MALQMIRSNGAFVALVFCFFNREVQGQLKSCFLRLARSGGYTGGDFTRASGYSTTTQYATELSRTRSVHHAGNGGGGDNAHIPLRPIYCPKNNGSDVRAKDDNSDADLANNGALHTIMEKSEEFSPLNPGPERDSRI